MLALPILGTVDVFLAVTGYRPRANLDVYLHVCWCVCSPSYSSNYYLTEVKEHVLPGAFVDVANSLEAPDMG